MSFRRTAIGLIIIAVVTALAIGVYLWYNFNSRSSLILVVPKNCNWIYHIQTSKIRKEVQGEPPAYLDSVTTAIRELPIFQGVKDPADPGIKLYSDIVLFGNKYGTYAAISLNSESKFREFLQKLPERVKAGNVVQTPFFEFLKMKDKPLYFAFKHKALVVFMPKDTSDNLQSIETGLNIIFANKDDYSVAGMKLLKPLYEEGCDVIYYQKDNAIPTHGVIVKNLQAKFVSGHSGREIQAKGPLKIFDGALVAEKVVVKKNKTISSKQYMNLTFKTLFLYLKPYTQ